MVDFNAFGPEFEKLRKDAERGDDSPPPPKERVPNYERLAEMMRRQRATPDRPPEETVAEVLTEARAKKEEKEPTIFIHSAEVQTDFLKKLEGSPKRDERKAA
ncbi:MAG: hypothetical protein Q7R93_05135 [bacterium]|nr:hypothetical protein [bacterium]